MTTKIFKRLISLIPFSLLCILALPQTALAVPPPDFLFNIGSSLAQVFSVAAIFLSAIFGISYKFIQTRLALMQSKKILFIGAAVVVIVGISIGSTYLYGNYKQNAEYQKWLEESQKYAQMPGEQEQYIKENKIKITPITTAKKEEQEIDKLKIGEASGETPSEASAAQGIQADIDESLKDPNTKFIKEYYKAIADSEFEKAYEMSKKSVSLDTFKSWYVNTTKITVDKLVRIDDTTSSLELTLYEGDSYTRYGVLMALKYKNSIPVQVSSSDVKTLGKGSTTAPQTTATAAPEEPATTFFSQNKDQPLSISNSKFEEITTSGENNYVILDAREDLEYSYGNFPGSIHIRYADLQAGKWIEIPDDKFVYVLCWSGIRGKEVSEFLRTKNIVASYLENGANGWVDFGGTWEGSVKFGLIYTEERYKKIHTTKEVKQQVAEGVILVDCREPWKFENWHIAGSVNIPIMYTPTIDIDNTFAQVPENSTIITICDDYVNCFDAKITGVELENRGQTFLGRYNKPWEYE